MSRRPVTEFTARVRGVIRAIPRGRVMTYGAVALAAGSPRAARGVVWILHSSSETERLPWHRVVGAGGRIALDPERGGDLQRAMLEAEGIELGMRGAIDIDRYGFRPSPPRRGRETAGRY
jgi:methylated-DNA-protein-cysteine methyltransferase related protein